MNPEVITLIATLDCNLNCPFCRHKELTEQFGRPSVFMSVDTAKKILQRHWDSDYIVVTGGEPMLNQELIDYLISLRRPMKILTNGTITLNDISKLHSDVSFVISENEETNSPLLNQLLSEKVPCQISASLYLDKDIPKLIRQIQRLNELPIRGYKVNVDIWAKEGDDELEALIEDYTSAAAPLLSDKDLGYNFYWSPDGGGDGKVIKYSPTGEVTKTLYGAMLPEKAQKQIEQESFNDKWIFVQGHKTFERGKIEKFPRPTEYYHCLMYELLKQKSGR